MTGLFSAAWTAPAALPLPPRRVWRDWALVAIIVPLTILETVARWVTPGVPVWGIVTLLIVPTLLWRRQRPFAMLGIAYLASEIAGFALGREGQSVSSAFVLVLLYAVFRWGSGRSRIGGVAILVTSIALSTFTETDVLGTLIAGVAVTATIILVAVLMRQRAATRLREIEGVRARERAELARDLHDIVAHHVSAITVQAQAGLATAANDPAAAILALEIIEAEASRTLSEMRAMVRTLRDTETTEVTPLPGITELLALAGGTHGPSVGVRTDGPVDDLPPAIAAAVYRLAQESVTNARRHAKGATLIDVLLVADDSGATLTVSDNGTPGSAGSGYGIPGMTERASLLGGTFAAGPAPTGGWATRATLPRSGWTA